MIFFFFTFTHSNMIKIYQHWYKMDPDEDEDEQEVLEDYFINTLFDSTDDKDVENKIKWHDFILIIMFWDKIKRCRLYDLLYIKYF